MADSEELSIQLKALMRELNLEDGELRSELTPFSSTRQEFSATSFSNAVHGHLPRGGKVYQNLATAVADYAAGRNLDIESLVDKYASEQKYVTAGDQRILSRLKGAWFFVQHRAIREVQKDDPARPDLRFAVLIFGNVIDGTRLSFQVIARTTTWLGEVSSHSQDKLLYYSAKETERKGLDEKFDLITHHSYTGGRIAFQSGIVLGIAHGEYEGSVIPIYASKATLWRIGTASEKALVAPVLEQAEIARLRGYCGYLAVDQIETALETPETDPLKKEWQSAVRQFRSKSIRNCGDRIFVER